MPFQQVPRNQWTFRRRPDWGDVYWFNFGAPVSGQTSFAGVHPGLIIADRTVILPGTTQILPLSGSEHRRQGYQCHVLITKTECSYLDKDSIVKVDQIYCVLTNELPDQYFMGTITPQYMRRIYAQLLRVLGVNKFSAT